MRAVLVEDEINVREGFTKMLKAFCPEVDVIATADSVETAKQVLVLHELDVLFLDINLPDGSGFDLLHQLKDYKFKVVFVTAYSQYAISAFKMSAVDYLLKPVSPDLLQKSIEKVKEGLDRNASDDLKILKNNLSDIAPSKKKIILKDINNIHIVELAQIVYCNSDGSYTSFVLEDGKTIITSVNLKEYEEMLSNYEFIRCHHSFLVNINHIKRMSKVDGLNLILTGDVQVPVSKRKKSIILDKINNSFLS